MACCGTALTLAMSNKLSVSSKTRFPCLRGTPMNWPSRAKKELRSTPWHAVSHRPKLPLRGSGSRTNAGDRSLNLLSHSVCLIERRLLLERQPGFCLNIIVIWDITPYSLVEAYLGLSAAVNRMMMEAVRTSETSDYLTRLPESCRLHTHCRENLNSQMVFVCSQCT
jgi:hypothetical protein